MLFKFIASIHMRSSAEGAVTVDMDETWKAERNFSDHRANKASAGVSPVK